MKVSAIVPVAGTGIRMGTSVPKQFLLLKELPLPVHVLKVFESVAEVEEVILVVSPGQEDRCRKDWIDAFGLRKVNRIVPGGSERQESVYAGLQEVSEDTEIVLVHDGVRPFLSHEMVRDVIRGAEEYGAAVVSYPVSDTLKKATPDGFISETVDRTLIWMAQTPQAFSRKILLSAHQRALEEGISGTDDSALVEGLGCRVRIIQGAWENIKITRPEDLLNAQSILLGRDAVLDAEKGSV